MPKKKDDGGLNSGQVPGSSKASVITASDGKVLPKIKGKTKCAGGGGKHGGIIVKSQPERDNRWKARQM